MTANHELSELDGRVEVVAGSFFERVPPADLLILKTVLHDWSDAKCTVILERCRQAMSPGSRLLIVDRVIEEPVEVLSLFYDLHMLVQIGGRERTATEFRTYSKTPACRCSASSSPPSSPVFPLRLVEASLYAHSPRTDHEALSVADRPAAPAAGRLNSGDEITIRTAGMGFVTTRSASRRPPVTLRVVNRTGFPMPSTWTDRHDAPLPAQAALVDVFLPRSGTLPLYCGSLGHEAAGVEVVLVGGAVARSGLGQETGPSAVEGTVRRPSRTRWRARSGDRPEPGGEHGQETGPSTVESTVRRPARACRYSEMKLFYNLLYSRFRAPWDLGPRKELVEVVESGRIQPCRAIDLGCGTASNAIFLAQHGFDVTGTDYSPAAIALCWQRGGPQASLSTGSRTT